MKSQGLAPIEQVKAIVSKAFSKNGRRNRRLYRNIRQALKLASIRGFKQSKEFFDFFSAEKCEERVAKRLVKSLLSYVSLTEFMQLAAVE